LTDGKRAKQGGGVFEEDRRRQADGLQEPALEASAATEALKALIVFESPALYPQRRWFREELSVFTEPLIAVGGDQFRVAFPQRRAQFIALAHPRQGDLHADELCPVGVPLLVEPVGVRQARGVVVRGGDDGVEVGFRGWHVSSFGRCRSILSALELE